MLKRNTYIMKKIIRVLLPILLFTLGWSCTQDSGTEKHQDKRDRIVKVRDKVKEIVIDEVLIGRNAQPFLMNDYLLIDDYGSGDKHIHLFDKSSFRYLTSTAYKGEGPDEITIAGSVGIDEANRKFYMTDHGKLKLFSFDLDRVLADPFYMPEVKRDLNNKEFPSDYYYINDTLCYAVIIKPTGSYGFNQCIGKWNMSTGAITPMKYTHPEIKKKRVSMAVSEKNGIYAESYHHNDLLTICTLDGELKYNVYGPKWNNQNTNRERYYGDILFCSDNIMTSTSFGRDNFGKEDSPTTFLVFDLEGNYLQTLEVGYNIVRFCYDQDNNRIIMVLDDEIQFAYLDLNGII